MILLRRSRPRSWPGYVGFGSGRIRDHDLNRVTWLNERIQAGSELDGVVSHPAMNDRLRCHRERHCSRCSTRCRQRERALRAHKLALKLEQRASGFGKSREVRLPPIGIDLLALTVRLGTLDPKTFDFALGLEELCLGEIARPIHFMYAVRQDETPLLETSYPGQCIAVGFQCFGLIPLLLLKILRALREELVEPAKELERHTATLV